LNPPARALFKNQPEVHVTKVAKTVEEAIPLIEVGYVEAADYHGVNVFKKKKVECA
jgi:hypothetical protein